MNPGRLPPIPQRHAFVAYQTGPDGEERRIGWFPVNRTTRYETARRQASNRVRVARSISPDLPAEVRELNPSARPGPHRKDR